MAYNESIEARIKNIVSSWENTDSKKMFGGLCHLLNGNMFSGVYKDYLILRLGKENAEKALRSPFVKPFDITGRPMKGWIMVKEDGFSKEEELEAWLNRAKEFVRTLPAK
ncbi:MAG: TfoX/Sxy family protein [Desulfobacteraceae bacterium]|nr:TfoX/Sxy family protein [Desulfobacteraceae bacterium]